jgi:hypothetical protein
VEVELDPGIAAAIFKIDRPIVPRDLDKSETGRGRPAAFFEPVAAADIAEQSGRSLTGESHEMNIGHEPGRQPAMGSLNRVFLLLGLKAVPAQEDLVQMKSDLNAGTTRSVKQIDRPVVALEFFEREPVARVFFDPCGVVDLIEAADPCTVRTVFDKGSGAPFGGRAGLEFLSRADLGAVRIQTTVFLGHQTSAVKRAKGELSVRVAFDGELFPSADCGAVGPGPAVVFSDGECVVIGAQAVTVPPRLSMTEKVSQANALSRLAFAAPLFSVTTNLSCADPRVIRSSGRP